MPATRTWTYGKSHWSHFSTALTDLTRYREAMREDLVGMISSHTPEELEQLANKTIQDLLRQTDESGQICCTWEEVWELACVQLIVNGSKGEDDGRPFWDMEDQLATACELTTELLKSAFWEVKLASMRSVHDDDGRGFFCELMNMQPVSTSITAEVPNFDETSPEVDIFGFPLQNFIDIWVECIETDPQKILELLNDNGVVEIINNFVARIQLYATTREFRKPENQDW